MVLDQPVAVGGHGHDAHEVDCAGRQPVGKHELQALPGEGEDQ